MRSPTFPVEATPFACEQSTLSLLLCFFIVMVAWLRYFSTTKLTYLSFRNERLASISVLPTHTHTHKHTHTQADVACQIYIFIPARQPARMGACGGPHRRLGADRCSGSRCPRTAGESALPPSYDRLQTAAAAPQRCADSTPRPTGRTQSTHGTRQRWLDGGGVNNRAERGLYFGRRQIKPFPRWDWCHSTN